ncbi:MAG: mechanosensitive ion channel family protein [Acidobacteriota bacterium]|nr:mechanosensitive ion channel family protein [Acidobacteriota bacterium]
MQSATDTVTNLPTNSLEVTLAVAMTALAALAMALFVGALVRRGLRRVEGERIHTASITDATVRAMRRVTFVLAFLLLLFPALDLAGVEQSAGWHAADVTSWATQNGVRILLLVLLAFAANRFAASVIRRAEHEMVVDNDPRALERRKRAQTLGATFQRFLSILIWLVASLMVLRELDVDITPVLTGAGIIGLAIGFGAQSLVRDIISGVFLIAENQIRIGDVALINGTGGMVEEINLRTVVLRDFEGVVHTITNGEIRTLANRTKDFSCYVIDIGVDYNDDTDRIVEVVRETGAALMADPAYGPSMLEPVEVVGLDSFNASDVTLRFRIKTVPLKQWEVGREMRRRIKKAFDAAGIRIPFPQMDVTVKQPPAPPSESR